MKKKSNHMMMTCMLTAVIILSGCGSKPVTNSGDTKPEPNPPSSNASSPSAPSAEKKETYEIEVAYVDPELTQVKTKKAEITFSDNDEKYTQALDVLQHSDDPNYISLWSDIGLESLEYQDGKLTLNIHIPDEARLGSGGELLFLDVLQQTLFQFEEVQSIQLLVDGKETESLMGHVELENPIVREKE
ncbi:GerMN domain-containing protein [Paenibacillus sp.]|uniref:GerMN domain-containing protein n=1 Tax=Paenibacillus sp. TaxID=58172 RepID=UPI0025D541F1|nr:GerMN domain-containing protein [Paenibacillus sp.]